MKKEQRIKLFLETVDLILSKTKSDKKLHQFFYQLIPFLEKRIASNATSSFSYFEKVKIFIKNIFLKNEIQLTSKSELNDIIFWPFQLHHLDYCIPIIQTLQKENCKVLTVVSRKDLIPQLKKSNIPFSFIKPHYTYFPNLQGFNRTIYFFKLLASIPKGKLNLEIKNNLWQSLSFIPTTEQYKMAFNNLASINKPLHIIGYDLSVIGLTLSQNAALKNHNTLRIQNGAVNVNLVKYSKITHALLWDSISEKLYSHTDSNIVTKIVGPILKKQDSSKQVREYFERKKKEFSLISLIAFSGSGHQTSEAGHKANIEILNQLCQAKRNNLFFIKLHAKDSLHYYSSLKNYSNVEIIHFEDERFKGNMEMILNNVNYVITTASTVMFEAFRKNIPVFNIDGLGEVKYILENYKGLINPNSNINEVLSAIEFSNSNEGLLTIKNYFEEFKNLNQKNPVKNIISFILELIKK